MRHRARLSPTQVDEIVRMFHAGASAAEIADVYGVSAQAIHARLRGRGLCYRRRPTARERLAIDMRRNAIHLLRGRNLALAAMAKEVRLAPDRLRRWLRKHMPSLLDQLRSEHPRARAEPRPSRRAPAAGPKRRRKPLHAPQAARVCRDYHAGYSTHAIARHYRSSSSSVWRTLRRHGVELRPRVKRSPMWLAAMRARRERKRAR